MLPSRENVIDFMVILQNKDCIYPCLPSDYLGIHKKIIIILFALF